MATLANGIETLEVGATAWRLIINANLDKLYTKTEVDNTFVKKAGGVMTGAFTSFREAVGTATGATLNLATGNLFALTISGATTLVVSNIPTTGQVFKFVLELTNGGSAPITWFTGAKFVGGVAPVLTTSGLDIIECYTRNGGTTWNVLVLGKDVK